MKDSEIISGLGDLIEDRKSFYTKDGDDEIFRHDVEILKAAIDVIKQNEAIEKE